MSGQGEGAPPAGTTARPPARRFPVPTSGHRLPGELRRLTTEEPVCRVVTNAGFPAWLVTGYRETLQVLRDSRFSLVRTSRRGIGYQDHFTAPLTLTGFRVLTQQAGLRPEMLRALGPAHSDVTPEWLETTAEELMSAAERRGGPADLRAVFTVPLVTRSACRLLGVPEEDGPLLMEWALRDLRTQDSDASSVPAGAEEVLAMWEGLDAYFQRHLRAPRTDGTGLLARLTVPAGAEGRLSERQLAGVLAGVAVGALGNPSGLLGAACLVLLHRPDLVRRLRDNPADVPAAVEEIIRSAHLSGDGIARVATRDVRVGDVWIRRDELVLLPIDTAGQDPAVFPDPEAIDLDRPAYVQPGFGAGPHRCPAQYLARAQTAAAVRALLRRLPGMRPAVPLEEIRWEGRSAVRYPLALPVHF